MLDQFTAPPFIMMLFALGVELVIGIVLAASNGLAEFHKDVLVAFAVGFPIMVFLILWSMLARHMQDDPPI